VKDDVKKKLLMQTLLNGILKQSTPLSKNYLRRKMKTYIIGRKRSQANL
jgi:hypothetical protein